MLIVSLHGTLPEAGTAGVPEWVHLIPAGTVRGADGRGPYTLRDPAAVIRASMAAGRLPIDENHATDLAMRTGGAAPARGWIVALEARADGIWGRVEWTPAGQALLAERAYRGISPALVVDRATGEVRQLLRAALTNTPNLPQLATLHTTQEQGLPMDLTKLRKALGLAEDADEAALLAAAEAARIAVETQARQLRRIAEAAQVPNPEAADAEQIVTALQTQAAAAADAGQLAREVVALQAQIAALQQERARERAIAAVDAAIRAGKPIPAVLREHYIARHVQDPAGVEKELAALPSLHGGGLGGRVPPPPGAGQAGLGADEAEVVALLGLDPEAFAKEKARLGQIAGAA
ncbi:hypothetical protein GCM10010964_18610 [Caldovatus sediminis]|uniref:Mu-like prophage I protein n=1 Tax=Caldovatus sediminis TaxID=2041189 RepID=A0A8J2ZAS4_9PROT|nr:phage protease [Caldovatus sediminis]GGG30946.1 hypothetical protein GCM10010964_18610 [Caldovatus sediminis]